MNILKFNSRNWLDEIDEKYQYLMYIGTLECVMAKNTSITLGDHYDEFISKQLESGRFGSASEIVRAGLRLLEDGESKRQALRQLLKAGEDSGVSDYSLQTLIAELDDEQH
jgi:antitoxin ParD1/3/4